MRVRQGHVDNANPYDWPHDGSLHSTALVVIDMQRDCKFTTRFSCICPWMNALLVRTKVSSYILSTSLLYLSISKRGNMYLTPSQVCEEGGYLTHQGYSVKPMRSIIPVINTYCCACRCNFFRGTDNVVPLAVVSSSSSSNSSSSSSSSSGAF